MPDAVAEIAGGEAAAATLPPAVRRPERQTTSKTATAVVGLPAALVGDQPSQWSLSAKPGVVVPVVPRAS